LSSASKSCCHSSIRSTCTSGYPGDDNSGLERYLPAASEVPPLHQSLSAGTPTQRVAGKAGWISRSGKIGRTPVSRTSSSCLPANWPRLSHESSLMRVRREVWRPEADRPTRPGQPAAANMRGDVVVARLRGLCCAAAETVPAACRQAEFPRSILTHGREALAARSHPRLPRRIPRCPGQNLRRRPACKRTIEHSGTGMIRGYDVGIRATTIPPTVVRTTSFSGSHRSPQRSEPL
jgi:hypothetical protein